MRPFVALILLPLTTSLPAQADPPMPLRVGNRWDYAVATRTGRQPPVQTTHAVHDDAACTLPDGTELHQLRVTSGTGATTFEHWSGGAGGVHRHATGDRHRRGVLGTGAPMQLLPASGDAGATWTWQGPHDLIADEQGRDFTHRGERLDDADITVPAGAFRTVHVRIESLRDGHVQARRELWIARGVGIVRDEHRDAVRSVRRELTRFTPAADDDESRVRKALDEQLARPGRRVPNNRPFVSFVTAGPEALLVPARIAITHSDVGSDTWLVTPDRVVWFDLREADKLALATMAAFGSDSAILAEDVPLAPLALLLARTEAARHHLGRVTPVATSLSPGRPLPQDSHRQAGAEVQGGALDGTVRRIAVWITVRDSSEVQVATDLAKPAGGGDAR